MNSITLSRPYSIPIQVTRIDDGLCVLTAGRNRIVLDVAQLDQLTRFATGRPTIQRYVMALEAPQTDDLTLPG